MLRSIKSGQRKMRVLALKVVSGVVQDTLDARQVTASSGSAVLKVPMAQVPAVIGATAQDEKTITFATDFTGDIIIIGSDTAEKY
jgi:hypothetical protein